MLFHIAPTALPGGFTGVDVFFVISGYVVSSSLYRESTTSILHFVFGFYARRFLRILPALVACLTITALLMVLFVPSSWLSSTSTKTGLAAFYGFSNFALIWHSDGYFSPRADFNPFLHTWSLGVEEQFYLVFPLLFFVWLRYRESRTIGGTVVKYFLPAIALGSLAYSWFQTMNNQERAFYLLPSRFWELAVGSLLFGLHSKGKLLATTPVQQFVNIAIGLFLVGCGFAYSNEKVFPFPWAILPVLGTAILISALAQESSQQSKLLTLFENRRIVFVGKISYSLYLWHWPVYVILRWTVGLDEIGTMLFGFFLSFALASVSFRYLETPIRRSPVLLGRDDWQIIVFGILLAVSSYYLTVAVFEKRNALSLSVTSDTDTWYPYRSSAPKKPEHASQQLSGRTIYVIGDSHAGAYGTMLQMLMNNHGVRVKVFFKAGCGLGNLLYPVITEDGGCYMQLPEYFTNMEKAIKPGDIVFFASLRMKRLGSQWGVFDEKEAVAAPENPEDSLKRHAALAETIMVLDRLRDKSIHVVMDAPKPIFQSPPFRCSDWFNKENPGCRGGFLLDRQSLLLRREPAMQSLHVLKSMFPALKVWDPFPILCGSDQCSAFDDNGKPVFFDGDHLSAYGNRKLYSSFEVLVLQLLKT